VDAASPGATIRLADETFFENVSINKDLTLEGVGPRETVVDGDSAFRVFSIQDADVTLARMTIRNGSGSLGGGIYAGEVSGGLTLEDCEVIGNYAERGGGVYVRDGEVIITRSTISGNQAGFAGGGVFVSDYSGAYSGYGVTITNSTFTGNDADRGSAIFNYYSYSTVTITSSTIAQNTGGSQLANFDYSYYGVYYGVTSVAGSIIGRDLPPPWPNCDGTITSGGYNLVVGQTDGCGLAGPGDHWEVGSVSGLFRPLGDYGGLTRTVGPESSVHGLVVDQGGASCPTEDQRGVARPIDGDTTPGALCDKGAFELDPNDYDTDGVPDGSDNCSINRNPTQADADGDGPGDACDTCTDTDGDGYGDPGYPANTCGTDNCPQANPAQTNVDGDAYGADCECDDTWDKTYPGAPEVNDGHDNQCPGEVGHGIIDEILDGCVFTSGAGPPWDFSWTAQAGTVLYQVAYSADPTFPSDECWSETTSLTSHSHSWDPPPGGIYYCLVRPLVPHVGSWGQDPLGNERVFNCTGTAP
jgi:hypothetical protein